MLIPELLKTKNAWISCLFSDAVPDLSRLSLATKNDRVSKEWRKACGTRPHFRSWKSLSGRDKFRLLHGVARKADNDEEPDASYVTAYKEVDIDDLGNHNWSVEHVVPRAQINGKDPGRAENDPLGWVEAVASENSRRSNHPLYLWPDPRNGTIAIANTIVVVEGERHYVPPLEQRARLARKWLFIRATYPNEVSRPSKAQIRYFPNIVALAKYYPVQKAEEKANQIYRETLSWANPLVESDANKWLDNVEWRALVLGDSNHSEFNQDGHFEQTREIDAFLNSLALLQRTQPNNELTTQTRGRSSAREGQRGANSELVSRILSAGSLSIAAMQVSHKAYEVVVDISGIPLISSLNVVKSLILDSWIVTSNTLAPVAGQVGFEYAFVRGLIMLLVKRVIRIKQLGPVRDVMTIISFVQLAAAVTGKVNGELETVLSQISAIPLLIYTALARIIVDTAANVLERDLETLSGKVSGLLVGTKGQFGKNYNKLVADWRGFMRENPVLASFVSKRALSNTDQRTSVLKEFSKNAL